MRNTWEGAEQAREFLTRADKIPYRGDGEMVLVADLAGALPGQILDLGCGDGRLTALLLAEYPGSTALLVDLSDTMLAAARERFDGDDRVSFAQARLDEPLPVDGPFDAIVSSLAIHHVTDERKQSLYAESAALLAPGGVFANLEIVASPTPELHVRWREEMGARRPVGQAARPFQPAAVARRRGPRPGRLHLEVAQPRPHAAASAPPADSADRVELGRRPDEQRLGHRERDGIGVVGPFRIQALVQPDDLRPAAQQVGGGPVGEPLRVDGSSRS